MPATTSAVYLTFLTILPSLLIFCMFWLVRKYCWALKQGNEQTRNVGVSPAATSVGQKQHYEKRSRCSKNARDVEQTHMQIEEEMNLILVEGLGPVEEQYWDVIQDRRLMSSHERQQSLGVNSSVHGLSDVSSESENEQQSENCTLVATSMCGLVGDVPATAGLQVFDLTTARGAGGDLSARSDLRVLGTARSDGFGWFFDPATAREICHPAAACDPGIFDMAEEERIDGLSDGSQHSDGIWSMPCELPAGGPTCPYVQRAVKYYEDIIVTGDASAPPLSAKNITLR